MSTPSQTLEPRPDVTPILQGLERFYRFENPSDFKKLLQYHPNIALKLTEAIEHLEACFGAEIELFVRVQREWEGPLVWVFVCGNWSSDEAEQKYQKFNDHWGLSAWSATGGMLNVDVRMR